MNQMDMFQEVEKGADISDCETYRYRLWRIWDDGKPIVVWIMLNPSTADATKDDPTIRQCMKFSDSWGYGGIMVVNLFAVRASDPRFIRSFEGDPVGPHNDEFIVDAIKAEPLSIAAWGNHGWIRGRDMKVLDLARGAGVSIYHLGLTKQDRPKHPLARGQHRIPGNITPIPLT